MYGTSAYFAAVVLFDILPLRVVPPCLFAFVSYWMIGLRSGCASCLVWFMLLMVLSNLASTTMCMAVGAATSSNAVANVASTFLLMLFLLFGEQTLFSVLRATAPCSCICWCCEGF